MENKEFENKIEYLESERKKLWERLVVLEDELKAYKQMGTVTTTLNKAKKIKEKYDGLNQDFENIQSNVTFINENADTIKGIYEDIVGKRDSINSDCEKLPSEIQKLKELVNKNETLSSDLDDIETNASESEEKLELLKGNLSSSIEIKNQISAILKQITGYDTKNEKGETVHQEGLRDELTNTYDEISEKLETLKQEQSKVIAETISSWKTKYKNLEEQIKSLLPKAMTAGLSSAYSNKVNEESNRRSIMFFVFICSLLLMSAIGIWVKADIWYMKIVYSLPLFWLAIFSNKQVNLSKKIIEAYEHKKAVSQTFEGLSKQIEQIQEEDIASELRIKLLQQTLEANSENPSKCITNYNNSDNPILEVCGKINLTKILQGKNGGNIFSQLLYSLKKDDKKENNSIIDNTDDK